MYKPFMQSAQWRHRNHMWAVGLGRGQVRPAHTFLGDVDSSKDGVLENDLLCY